MEGDHSPRFGNWDTDANVPYTQYFEKVVKGRTEVDKVVKGRTEGKSVNSSHPDENPDTFSKDEAATHRTRPETELPKPKNDSRAGEDGDRTRDSPTRSDTVAPKPISVSPRHRTADRTVSGESQRKMYKTNGGAVDRSIDTSPLHSQYQVKSAGRGGGPPWERKNPAEGSHGLSNTPGRPKLRTIGHGDDIPEKTSTVPPFGAWENDPSTADKYSDIFTKVRKEKEAGSPKVPNFATDSKYLYNKQDKKFKSSSCGCFNWGRK